MMAIVPAEAINAVDQARTPETATAARDWHSLIRTCCEQTSRLQQAQDQIIKLQETADKSDALEADLIDRLNTAEDRASALSQQVEQCQIAQAAARDAQRSANSALDEDSLSRQIVEISAAADQALVRHQSALSLAHDQLQQQRKTAEAQRQAALEDYRQAQLRAASIS